MKRKTANSVALTTESCEGITDLWRNHQDFNRSSCVGHGGKGKDSFRCGSRTLLHMCIFAITTPPAGAHGRVNAPRAQSNRWGPTMSVYRTCSLLPCEGNEFVRLYGRCPNRATTLHSIKFSQHLSTDFFGYHDRTFLRNKTKICSADFGRIVVVIVVCHTSIVLQFLRLIFHLSRSSVVGCTMLQRFRLRL